MKKAAIFFLAHQEKHPPSEREQANVSIFTNVHMCTNAKCTFLCITAWITTLMEKCAVLLTQEGKSVCGLVYLLSWIAFISVMVLFSHLSVPACVVCEWIGMKRKRSMPAVVSLCSSEYNRASHPEEEVLLQYLPVFERKISIKMIFFHLFHFLFQLCWDIPGAPWQSWICRFPFQTGLSCPSHHQGSLLKYIPSVKALMWRVNGMEQWQEGGKVVRKKCLRPPAQPFPLGLMAGRLSP